MGVVRPKVLPEGQKELLEMAPPSFRMMTEIRGKWFYATNSFWALFLPPVGRSVTSALVGRLPDDDNRQCPFACSTLLWEHPPPEIDAPSARHR